MFLDFALVETELHRLADAGVVEWPDAEEMVALAWEVEVSPNRWDLVALFDQHERELYGRMLDLVDPPRIDSPESDGEGSYEGPDFDDDEEDEEDDDDLEA